MLLQSNFNAMMSPSRNSGPTLPPPEKRRSPIHGFSLVELVIVVVILGVLASIAVLKFAAGAVPASEAALRSSLVTLRKAIDQYAAEHRGVYPGAQPDGTGGSVTAATAFVNQLTRYSNENGIVADEPGPAAPLGPYLRLMPPAPVGVNKGSRAVAIDLVNPRPLVTNGPQGWVYNPSTGEIIVNSDDANHDGSRAYDEY